MLYNDCVCVCLFIQSFIQLQSFRFKKMKKKSVRCVLLCVAYVWYFKAKMFEVMVQSTTHMRIHTHFRNIRKPRLPLTQKKNHPRIKCLLFHVLEPVKIHLLMYRRIKSRRIVIIITNIILVFPSKRKRSDFSILFSPFFSPCLPC